MAVNQIAPHSADPGHATSKRGRMRAQWRESDHDQRKALILDAARSLLEAEGSEGMTMRRVAGRLGIGAMTLYTYVEGQDGLRRELVRQGFEALSHGCGIACEQAAADGESLPHPWWPGARHYVRFAMKQPALFRLMFDTPLHDGDEELLRGGFQPLLDRVRDALTQREGLAGETLNREARRVAGRYWIGIHGLAMLATTGRLRVLEGSVDDLLLDLLPRVGPAVDQPE